MTFEDKWREALYKRVPIHHGVKQWRPDLRAARDDDHGAYSDIALHLPVLEWFSSHGPHATEFGVRNVVSTLALVRGVARHAGFFGRVASYDVVKTPAAEDFEALSAQGGLPCRWQFHHASTLEADIEETDFLFIDTVHTAGHVFAELERHWHKVRKYVAFHDTAEDGAFACPPHNYLEGIYDFLAGRRDYRTAYRTEANNGLWVLEKI